MQKNHAKKGGLGARTLPEHAVLYCLVKLM